MASGEGSSWGKYSSLGFEVAGAIGLGAFIGWAVDHRLHSGPWGIVVGVSIGVAAAMYRLVRLGIEMNKD